LPGVLVGALLAGLVAFAAASLPRAVDVLAVALAATLLALVVEGPPVGAPAPLARGWPLRLFGWSLVVALLVATCRCTAADQVAAFAALTAVVLGAAACGRLGVATGAVAAAFVLAFADQPVPTPDGTVLARRGDAVGVYLRADQELQLRLRGQVLAAAGPDRDEEPLLLALLHAFARDGDVVTLLGRGTGRIEPALRGERRCVVEVRDAWPDTAALTPRTRVHGPVAPPDGHPQARPTAPFARPVAELPDASRQLLCVCELPVAATAHRATEAFQRQLRRAVGDGVVLQPIALDRVDAELLERLLRAAREAHPWTGVYAVGDAAVLVAAAARPCPRGGFDRWSEDARWALHRA
ncbi:MAG: hypothetical protein KAI24_10845, partial [Planctomycetes bacterium]|nr:hypothetical protein [Planctomycetota bacterium]